MIQLTRLNGQPVVVNAELIETVEATPDTLLTLTTARRIVVQESVAEVIARVISYRRSLCTGRPREGAGGCGSDGAR